MNRSRTFQQAVGVFCDPDALSGPIISGRGVILLFLTLMLSATAFGQSTSRISGTVGDALDGQVIANALVAVTDADFSTRTDFFGRFSLDHLPLGSYLVGVTAEGYEPYVSDRIEVVSDITRKLTVVLTRKIHYVKGSSVVGKRPSPVEDGTEVINRAEIAKSGVSNLADLLSGLRGLFVQKTGAGSDEVRVSIRGSDPKHVLVLLDGHRINAAASGEANLGGIPLAAVQRVEVYRGGESARFGADALGGVVNIVTGTDTAESKSEITGRAIWGPWKTIGREATATDIPIMRRFTSRLTYTERSSVGDFPYHYVVSSRPEAGTEYNGTRLNAGLDSRSWFFAGSWRPSGRTVMDYSGQWYRSREGLPGAVSAPDSAAWKKDLRMYNTLRLRHDLSTRSQIEVSLGATRLRQYFNNRHDALAAERYETRYTNDMLDVQATARVTPYDRNEFTAGMGLRRDILYHDDLYRPQASMGRTVRDNLGLYTLDKQSVDLSALPLLDNAALDVAVRWDHVHTANSNDNSVTADPDHWSHKTGLSLTSKGTPRIILRGSYGRSYRLPEINALFWKGDVRASGNPNLRPERAEHSDAGIELNLDRPVTVSAGVTCFHSYVRDLIVWQPAYQDVWMPVNLDAAQLTGHEEYIRVGFWGEKIQLNYQNTVTVSKNRKPGASSYNLNLTYRPHYVTDIEAVLALWKLRGSYRVRLIDIRYNREANTKWYISAVVVPSGAAASLEVMAQSVFDH
ncbi:MAG: TonB-dependent receptor, partial [candidate division Zixibacteria bacterium]|nr:TonB-dependent receptor [candidate division Zixibacteria bacterium]